MSIEKLLDLSTGSVELLRLPLPGIPLKYVNVYLVRDGTYEGLVDAGMFSMASMHSLLSGLRRSGSNLCDLDLVIVTHFHVDHLSLLPSILEASRAEAYMGARDARLVDSGATAFINRVLRLYQKHGMPEEELRAISRAHPLMRLSEVYLKLIPSLEIKPLNDGDRIDIGSIKLRVVSTPGHTPGSIILVHEDTGAAFTGDTLLPRITPHIILYDEESDPLGKYLNTLRRIMELNLTVALPGHGEPIKNPSERAREILEFHEERLKSIVDLLSNGAATAHEIARKLKWRVRYNSWEEYPPPEKFFAMGEALAHLKYLKLQGIVDYYEERGVKYWYLTR